MGTLETLFQHARQQFVDEIFFTTPCERGVVQEVLEQARIQLENEDNGDIENSMTA